MKPSSAPRIFHAEVHSQTDFEDTDPEDRRLSAAYPIEYSGTPVPSSYRVNSLALLKLLSPYQEYASSQYTETTTIIGTATTSQRRTPPPARSFELPTYLFRLRDNRSLIGATEEVHAGGGKGCVSRERVVLGTIRAGIHEICHLEPVNRCGCLRRSARAGVEDPWHETSNILHGVLVVTTCIGMPSFLKCQKS